MLCMYASVTLNILFQLNNRCPMLIALAADERSAHLAYKEQHHTKSVKRGTAINTCKMVAQTDFVSIISHSHVYD